MELGGVITINCEKTGYKAEIEFKLKVRRSRVSVSGAPISKKFGSKPLQSLCCVLRQDTFSMSTSLHSGVSVRTSELSGNFIGGKL